MKRFESGMVVNPITMTPDQSLAGAEPDACQPDGRVFPSLSVRQAAAFSPTATLFRRESSSVQRADDQGIWLRSGLNQPDVACRILHQRRIEKLLVVDDSTIASG